MSFQKIRTPKNSPLNTFVSSPIDDAQQEGSKRQSVDEYIPFRINYQDVPHIHRKKLPSSFMCNSNLMTTPIDQGNCGSCWSFATCASLTDRINILCNKKIIQQSLSPTIPLTCNFFLEERKEPLFDKDYVQTIVNLQNILNNFGCYGNSVILTCFFMNVWGTFDSNCAFYNSEYIQDLQYDRTNFGYRSSLSIQSKVNFSDDFNSTSCNTYFGDVGRSLNASNCLGRVVNNQHIYVKPAQMYRILFYYSIQDSVTNNENIMHDILLFGPIVTSFQVYNDFYSFDPKLDGVYQSNMKNLVGGHAVCIVGWGEYKDPKSSQLIPFWWIKNSWGKDYGMNGYFRMLRGKNMCGIEKNVVGMFPNTYPENEEQLNDTMNFFYGKMNLQKQINPSYLALYKHILHIFSHIGEEEANILFHDQLLTKYPIIDYFFFHTPFKMNFKLDPRTGFSQYNQIIYPGLDFKPPYTIKTMKNIYTQTKKKQII